jgi:AcrR family transcriptional regulator
MTSREKILNAAVAVFAKKGRNGAHMEEIAAEASINKAMIYYIFHGKDELYQEVLKKIFSDLFAVMLPQHVENKNKGLTLPERLVSIIDMVFTSFTNNKNFTRIVVDAISNGTDEIEKAMQYCKEVYGDDVVKNEFTDVVSDGIGDCFRDVDTDQLGLSIYGMVLIFYLSRPLCNVLDIKVNDDAAFLEQRKKSIIDLILNGVLARPS